MLLGYSIYSLLQLYCLCTKIDLSMQQSQAGKFAILDKIMTRASRGNKSSVAIAIAALPIFFKCFSTALVIYESVNKKC